MSTDNNEFNYGVAETYAKVNPDEMLSENKVEDLVDYIRGNYIKNEEQAVVTLLAWISGWFAQPDRFVNVVTIGTTGSGKTGKDKELKPLIPSKDVYEATSGSDKSFIDDPGVDNCRVMILSEWQKLGDDPKEFMKSTAGDDGGFTYSRSKAGSEDANEDGPAGTNNIEKPPKPFSFTYAQFSMDNEMWTRLFKIYIDEGRDINEAVSRMHAGHQNISMPSWEYDYVYETTKLRSALAKHIRSIPKDAYVHMPAWVHTAVSDVIDTRRSESKRVSAMVFNLIRSSTLFNYEDRQTRTVTRDGDKVEAYVVEPQDVANVLSCRKTLLGTTHELEPRKLEIVDAVRTRCKMGDENYALLEDVQEYFQSERSNMSLLKKDTLRELLRELDENFIIKEHERVEGNAHGYEFLSLSHIGHPTLRGFGGKEYTAEDPFVGVENPDDPFEDSVDPIEGQSFKDSVEAFKREISDKVADESDLNAADAMGGSSQSNDGQMTLGGGSTDKPTVEGHVESYVYNQLVSEADGCEFALDGLEHEHVLGIVEEGERVLETDFSDTILDPENSIWTPPGRGKALVNGEDEARAKIEEVYRQFTEEGIVEYEKVDDETIVVHVADAEVTGLGT